MDRGTIIPRLARAGEIAAETGLSRQRIYSAGARGLLPAVRVGKLVSFVRDAVAAWIAAGGAGLPRDAGPAAPAPREAEPPPRSRTAGGRRRR